MTEFDPKIIAFCCNWCSYVGADLAGTSRLQYPHNIRIIRTICSGQVFPSYILRALELGADGVMVAGCHVGDCHYVSGNKKAQQRVEMLLGIMKNLGLDTRRVRLEWISASEGLKFANTIKEFVDEIKELGPIPLNGGDQRTWFEPAEWKKGMKQIIGKTKAYYCVECGKCAGSCPVARVNEGFSPRVIVERALSGMRGEIEGDRELWACLTCEACSAKCPSTLKYSEFIRDMRSFAFNSGYSSRCSQGGLLHSIQKLQSTKDIVQDRLQWVSKDLKTSEKGEVFYFIGCLPYFEKLFSSFVNPLEIARSTVKILNKVGIVPAVSPNERCCGHDLLWTGDEKTFQKLARLNTEMIKKSGASRIVTTCPECLRTLKIDYENFLKGMDIEIIHISELISSLIKNNDLKFNRAGIMTYHDSCRLGRHMGIYDAPRDVIKSMGELVEMGRNRTESSCCGVSAWATCEGMSRQMQIDRLIEAKSTGADILVTSCPKCLIHLKCAVHNQIPVEREKVDIPVEDLAVVAGRALAGD